MTRSTVLALTLAAASLVPVPADAASGRAGLDACVEALMEELAKTNGAPVGFSMRRADPGMKPLGRRTTFHVDAMDPKTNRVVARADCVVDSRAEVLELTPVPVSAPPAPRRARADLYSMID